MAFPKFCTAVFVSLGTTAFACGNIVSAVLIHFQVFWAFARLATFESSSSRFDSCDEDNLEEFDAAVAIIIVD